jgi:hypothetical protein
VARWRGGQARRHGGAVAKRGGTAARRHGGEENPTPLDALRDKLRIPRCVCRRIRRSTGRSRTQLQIFLRRSR